jgi:hypothetical protein
MLFRVFQTSLASEQLADGIKAKLKVYLLFQKIVLVVLRSSIFFFLATYISMHSLTGTWPCYISISSEVTHLL